MKRVWRKLTLNLVAMFVSLFLFMRLFLTSSGFIIYRDFFWPYTPNLLLNSWNLFDPNLINVNFGQADPTGCFRILLTWPLAILTSLGVSSANIERVFFGGIFCLVYGILYLASLAIDKIAGKHPPEIVRILLLLVIASNFYVMQTITWYPLWLGFALVTLLAAELANWLIVGDRRDLWLASLAWVVLSFLDIRFLIWSPVVFIAISFTMLLASQDRLRLARRVLFTFGVVVLIVAPFYVSLYAMNGASFRSVGSVGGLLSSAQEYISRAPSVIDAITLRGYFFSSVNYVPPTNSISGIWIMAAFVFPLVLGMAIFMRKKASLAFAFLGIIGLDLSVGTNSPINALVFSLANNLGSTGQLILIPFIPSYYSLILVACGYSLCLYYVCLFVVPNKFQPIRRLRFAIILLLITTLLFSSWQFYNGSLYPSGTVGPGSDVTQSVGVMQPFSPPLGVLQAYSWLGDQPGLFNTVWVPGTFGYAYTWNNKSSPFNEYYTSPKPFVDSFVYFPFSTSNNLTSTLDAYHVKYVIVQDDTEPITLNTFYKSNNVTDVRNALASNGLALVKTFSGSVWVYQNLSAPRYISCDSQANNPENASNSVSWREMVPSYWVVDVTGADSVCNLTIPMKFDSGWVAFAGGLRVYHPSEAQTGLLQFSVPAGESYSLVYLPYFFAVLALISIATSILVMVLLVLGKKSALWSFHTLVT
ncbi:MAG: hypothetical protein JRN67_02575, partial [Nitrososphaerota archaeon]|nr:hypothetical protein [Nitrososphaerota archaeon]